MNLENRLRKALAALEELNAPQPHVYRRPDEERLRGKIEGVKLALSYIDEERRELERIYQEHRAMSKLEYGAHPLDGLYVLPPYADSDVRAMEVVASTYREAIYAEQYCGDWPAPCNCDDPRTHNGH